MCERPAWVEIDLKAIEHNVLQFKNLLVPRIKLCAVVKADGYGHGAVAVANAALRAGADYLAVAVLGEGIELRQAGILAPILVLGYTPAQQAPLLVRYNLMQSVFTISDARALSAAAMTAGQVAAVHLKVDTGMRRIGVPVEESGNFAAAVNALPGLNVAGVFTHLASSDEADKTYAMEQLTLFQDALKRIEGCGIKVPICHASNSAAITDLPEAHFDMVRLGISLYGLWSSSQVEKKISLLPAMQVKCRVTFIKDVPSRSFISYGCTFQTSRQSRIATLPIGYADGWGRSLSNRGRVLVRGHYAPLVGRVCMDQCMIDVTDIPGVSAGDEVLLFGSAELPAEEVADSLGTIVNELVCMYSKKRLPRFYKGV